MKKKMMTIASIITELSFTPIRPRGTLLGFCSLLYRGELFLGNIALHATSDGKDFKIYFPDKILFNGVRTHIYYPVSKEISEIIKQAITDHYLTQTRER
jgi:hypothetical protein